MEETRAGGQDDITSIIAAVEEIVKSLADKTKPGEYWTSVAQILPWKKHQHLRDRIDKKWEELKSTYGKKVHFIPKLSKLAFGTGHDEVHLVDKSRERLFNHVIESSLKAFSKELGEDNSTLDDEGEDELMDTTIVETKKARTSTPASFRQIKRKARDHDDEPQIFSKKQRGAYELGDDLQSLTRKVEQRWKSDALIFAKHDELLDTIRNKETLDRIVMSGVIISDLTGNLEERKAKMFEAVTKILLSFMVDPPEPTFANHLNPQFKTTRRVLEVRFGNAERAIHVRRTYAEKIKEFRAVKKFPEELNGINIGLTLTKATRIRIAVLKGLARIIDHNTEPNVKAYCLEYQPQPMMKVVIDLADNKTTSRTYGYTEAIEHVTEHFGIDDQDMIETYTLAGNMKGLDQKFVVLKNKFWQK